MIQNTVCPYCKEDFPLDKILCGCGAYRVTEENHDLSFKDRFGKKLTKKNVNEITGGG